MGGGRPTGSLEQGGFLLFLALVSAALIAIVLPFARSLLWAALAAIMFQPLYRCAPGGPLFAIWHAGARDDHGRLWIDSPHHVMDVRGDGAWGAHGGSGLSSFAGTIRRGELNATAPPIRHALKFQLHAHLSGGSALRAR